MEKEDVNNALLHIKSKHNGEIPYKYGSQECAKLMHSYSNERVIEELEMLGAELYKKEGTDSYVLRCLIHDKKEELKQK